MKLLIIFALLLNIIASVCCGYATIELTFKSNRITMGVLTVLNVLCAVYNTLVLCDIIKF